MIRAMLLVLLLNGCAVLSDHRVAAGCQVADGVTTWYALKHGAVESNGLLANLSPGAILTIKVAFAVAIWKAFNRETTKGEKAALTGIALLGCVPAAHNVKVIRSLP